MDSLIRIDDVIEKYVLQVNPLHGVIIADYALNVTALAARDAFWTNDFRGGTGLPRSDFTIAQAGQVFWTFFLKYCLPTAQEYFGWCREMLLNIACFEKLLGIKPAGVRAVGWLEDIMNQLALFLGYKNWSFNQRGGIEYSKILKENPPAAYNFILSLFPPGTPDMVLELEKCKAATDLLTLLRDCCIESVERLRAMIYNGKITPETGRDFTKSQKFIKCHSTILGQDFIKNTPNQNFRYPELYEMRWGDFQDRHTTLQENHGNGPLMHLIRQVPRDSPKSPILNELLYYSGTMPQIIENVIDDVVTVRIREGATQAMHAGDRHTRHLYLTHLKDEYITQFNYNVVLGLLLSDPIPLEQMDVDAGAGGPLQEPKEPKPEKKKEEPDQMVFWLVGLGALGLFAIDAF